MCLTVAADELSVLIGGRKFTVVELLIVAVLGGGVSFVAEVLFYKDCGGSAVAIGEFKITPVGVRGGVANAAGADGAVVVFLRIRLGNAGGLTDSLASGVKRKRGKVRSTGH